MYTRFDDVNCIAKNGEGQFKPWHKCPTYGTFLYSPVGHTPIGSLPCRLCETKVRLVSMFPTSSFTPFWTPESYFVTNFMMQSVCWLC